MKNLFQRVLMAFFIVACVLFGGTENICSAEFFNDESSNSEGRVYYVSAVDVFFQSNRTISIIISKLDVILNKYPEDDFYFYVVEILQRTDQNPFNIKSIVIMSESDTVEIPANDLQRQSGLEFVIDKIGYRDTGKVNRVIKSVRTKMLIRITTTGGVVYDVYPSEEYIADAKRVADWAYR